MTAPDLVTHRGGCHCGAVAFEVEAPADLVVYDCNCSICTLTGFLHVIVPRTQFHLLRGEDGRNWEASAGALQHLSEG